MDVTRVLVLKYCQFKMFWKLEMARVLRRTNLRHTRARFIKAIPCPDLWRGPQKWNRHSFLRIAGIPKELLPFLDQPATTVFHVNLARDASPWFLLGSTPQKWLNPGPGFCPWWFDWYKSRLLVRFCVFEQYRNWIDDQRNMHNEAWQREQKKNRDIKLFIYCV